VFLYHHPNDRDHVADHFSSEIPYEVVERDDVPPGRMYISPVPLEQNRLTPYMLYLVAGEPFHLDYIA
jgi:hypothetical protein